MYWNINLRLKVGQIWISKCGRYERRPIAVTHIIFMRRVLQTNLRIREIAFNTKCEHVDVTIFIIYTIFMLRAANKFQGNELHKVFKRHRAVRASTDDHAE